MKQFHDAVDLDSVIVTLDNKEEALQFATSQLLHDEDVIGSLDPLDNPDMLVPIDQLIMRVLDKMVFERGRAVRSY